MPEDDLERLGKAGVSVEQTDEECPWCQTRNLVKPRAELRQCPECLYVDNPMYLGVEGRDFDLTHRQGRLLLRAAGYDHGGSHGDIENGLRRMFDDLGIDREEFNSFVRDLKRFDKQDTEVER